MSDLSKRLFDAGCERDPVYADLPVDELVRRRIYFQQAANKVAAEIEFRQLLALKAVKS